MNRGIVTTLRDVVPNRPLTRAEALRIAELQAQKFLQLVDAREPPVPEQIITRLPRLQVARLRPFPASGASHWKNGAWMIVLNGREPETRQRFSLAHEFKHILDHRFIDIIYSGVPIEQRRAWAEQVCDYFAGCLLVPRPWLKRAYAGRLQDTKRLARHFDVSEPAIETRLGQIGLLAPTPRCDRTPAPSTLRARPEADTPEYLRTPSPAFALQET